MVLHMLSYLTTLRLQPDGMCAVCLVRDGNQQLGQDRIAFTSCVGAGLCCCAHDSEDCDKDVALCQGAIEKIGLWQAALQLLEENC